jgi:Big-like domain-containing protein
VALGLGCNSKDGRKPSQRRKERRHPQPTFAVSVKPELSGTATGTVSFYDGTTLLKTVGVNKGEAKFTTKTLNLDTHTITATYGGSTDFTGSSDSLTETVN